MGLGLITARELGVTMSRKSRNIFILVGALVLLGFAVLLFGVELSGWCNDSTEAELSECHTNWRWRQW